MASSCVAGSQGVDHVVELLLNGHVAGEDFACREKVPAASSWTVGFCRSP